MRLLLKDARLSNKQLAYEVELAPSTCHERVRRLRNLGVITGAHAKIDVRQLGFGITAMFMLGISRHEKQTIDSLFEELLEVEEVQAAYLITGRYDLIVNVIARDMEHLREIAYQHFTDRELIARFETSIVYEGRERPGIPFEH